jgi:hypothetical protein
MTMNLKVGRGRGLKETEEEEEAEDQANIEGERKAQIIQVIMKEIEVEADLNLEASTIIIEGLLTEEEEEMTEDQ